jgi:release factor glutamine methyltransferase
MRLRGCRLGGGVLLVVQPLLSEPHRTVEHSCNEAGLEASVTLRSRKPFGPVLRKKAAGPPGAGIAPGRREEKLVIVRADLTHPGVRAPG